MLMTTYSNQITVSLFDKKKVAVSIHCKNTYFQAFVSFQFNICKCHFDLLVATHLIKAAFS